MEEQMQNIKSFATDLELLSALHEAMGKENCADRL
jgi:hypothetical protein